MLNNNQRLYAGISLVALSVVLAGTAIAFPAAETPAAKTMPPAISKQAKAPPSPVKKTPGTSFRDGTYVATGSYFSPGGQESVRVMLTLNGGIVTAADVASGANDPTASSYQASFISGYKPAVIGKKITAIKLTNVAGSSLTSQGFNSALKQIERQAGA